MLPHEHLIVGIIFAVVLFLIFPSVGISGMFLIIASAVLIDVDHYIYYISKKNDKSLIRAYKWYIEGMRKTRHLPRKEKRKIYFGFHFLHGVEILAIIYFLYIYVSQTFLYIFLGYSLHLFADLLVEGVWYGTTDKISVIYSFFHGKKLKFIDEIELPSKNPLILHA